MTNAQCNAPEMAPSMSAGRSTAALVVVATAVLVGSYWRAAPVGSALMFGDEFHTLKDLGRGYRFLFTHFKRYRIGDGAAHPGAGPE